MKTPIENPYEKPVEKDHQAKYFAESFTLKEGVEWKGEFKKDFIIDFEFKSKYTYKDITTNMDKALEIHQNLLETNETYNNYYKEFCKRNTNRVTTPMESAIYLDLLVSYEIMTINLNEKGKFMVEVKAEYIKEKLFNMIESINHNNKRVDELVEELNRKENQKYSRDIFESVYQQRDVNYREKERNEVIREIYYYNGQIYELDIYRRNMERDLDNLLNNLF